MDWDDVAAESVVSEKPRDKTLGSSNLTKRETILIYGQPKTGKTYAVCSVIEKAISEGKNIFYINTDNGFADTAEEYFGDKWEEVKQKINYYQIWDIVKVYKIIDEIRQNARQEDLIVIDLISDFWNMAQHKFIYDLSNGDPVNYMSLASREKNKIGAFQEDKWQYIKKLNDMILRPLIIELPCNVVACCKAKDTDVAKMKIKDAAKQYELSKYDEVGSKPDGPKELPYNFRTIMYLGELKNGDRYFIVMGNRGFIKKKDMVIYKNNFYNEFLKLRKK